ncbi:MAG TPA: SSI family serine proteinase inhibitor [Gaiellales bacterium]|nr:SSI family serine proteinase inhibitor [Gaiellales bacterium]
MRHVVLILLLVATAAASAGCLGGSSAPHRRHSPAPRTELEITYLATVRRECPAGVRCFSMPLRRVRCPAGSRCVPPAAGARLVRCPAAPMAGVHCYALRVERVHGPWVILQQRDLSCSPAAGGYADAAAACRALADYLSRMRSLSGRMCMCPIQLWQSLAEGTFDGRPVTVDVSACATCGLGHAAIADRVALTPALGR